MQHIVPRRNVGKVCVTPIGLFIPSEHRVDGIAQLSRAGFVDTAGVDRYIVEATLGSMGAAAIQFVLSPR